MRLSYPLCALGGALALAGCSSTGTNQYQADFDRLEADCRAREGILVPTGKMSGRPQVDNACRITGGPSDRIQRD